MAEAPDAAKRALLDTCLRLPGAYEDYPFGDDMATVRHRHNRKIFAFVFHRGGRLQINLKCEPLRADFLRSMYQGVQPGWHMNHVHWNTVFPASDVPEAELLMMISDSWKLTGGGKAKPRPTAFSEKNYTPSPAKVALCRVAKSRNPPRIASIPRLAQCHFCSALIV